MKYHELDETTRAGLDALSILTVVGTLIDMLPSIAAVVTIVWTSIRIYETDTVQKLLRRKKEEEEGGNGAK
jgi:hypothetical protein